ncbi:response regulator transcription factor, partial [Streptomyces sp. WAC06614]|uniref:response regulator n=1 Tax=Streptomyces sp. WAC06614 TaxID=2487416 RepID=UPI000FAF4D13
MTISVVIADDQEMVRTGFRMILESQPDIEVLADVVDGEAALAAVEEHRPDVLLLDIRMPKLDGLEVTRRLSGRTPAPRIVIVTTFDLDEYVHAALHGGASGFLLKDASPAMLVEAVRAAAVGDSLVSPAITVRLLRDLAPRATATAA